MKDIKQLTEKISIRSFWFALVLMLVIGLGACSQVSVPEAEEIETVELVAGLATVTLTRSPAIESSYTAEASATVVPPEATLPPATATLQPAPIQPTIEVNPEVLVVTPDSSPMPMPADPFLREVITQAKDDLARRLQMEPGQIEFTKLDLVVWSDASLGCPQPGMAYIQVPQEGYLILLRARGRIYHYHGGGDPGQPPFLCENPSGPNITFPPPRSGDQ